MSLPWVRLDSNIAGHDKILSLIETKPEALAFRAAFSYCCSLGYAGGNDTDGLIKFVSLPFIHGTKKTAELLVTQELWTPDPDGWRIVNYGKRQQLSAATAQVRSAQSAGGRRANCVRWHGKECGCWEATA